MKKNIFRILGFASDNNLIPVFLLLVFSLFPAHAFGAEASFVWSANTESDIAGYKIYYGTASGNYTQYVDVGNTTEYTQTGLQDGVTYYFASTAYDTAGNESDFSTEIEVDASGQQNQNPDPPTTPTGPSSGYIQTNYSYGTSGTDPDGDPLEYQFDWGDGEISGWNDASSRTHAFAAVGNFCVRAQARDSHGASSGWSQCLNIGITHQTHTITVPTDNSPPVANAGADQTVVEGDTVTLSAASSFDPDDNIDTYSWNQINGPMVTLTKINLTDVTFTAPDVDTDETTLSFQLTLQDSEGLQAFDSCIARVNKAAVIPQNGWTLYYVDSEELDAVYKPGDYAFDGNSNTIWHTQWFNADPPHPHEIQIDLGGFYDIDGFRYLPRQSGENGNILNYEFYVSSDGINWGVPVAEGNFLPNDKTEKEVIFPAAVGRYIRLQAIDEVNGNPWTTIAELNVLGTPSAGMVSIIPASVTLVVNGQQVFSGVGGLPPYSFDVTADTTGGATIDSNGFYTAGPSTGQSTVQITDANNDTAEATVTVNAVSSVLDQNGWTLHYVDSEELDAVYKPGDYAFDGNSNTIWHTQWFNADPPHPHEIQIDLGGFYDIDGLRYLPRQSGENGNILNYEFYVSSDGINWGVPVAEGNFLPNDKTEKEVIFPAAVGRYIRLQAIDEVNGNPWTTIAELNVLGTPSAGMVSIIPVSVTIVVNGQQVFSGVGGLPPYSFDVTADTTEGAAIDNNGFYTAGPSTGQSTVQITDTNNDTAEATVTVNAVSSF